MGFLSEIRSHPIRAAKSLAIMLCIIGLGFSQGILGPTILDLKTQVGRSLEDVAIAFPGRAGGYAVGSFIMGFVYEKLNMQVTAGICMVINAVLTAALPHISDLWTFLVVFSLNGALMGFFEVGANMFIFHLWGRESGPFIQTIYLNFGIGSLLIPIIAKPFLVSSDAFSTDFEFGGNETYFLNSSVSRKELLEPSPSDLALIYPYSIVAGWLAMCGILVFVIYFMYPRSPIHPSRMTFSKDSNKQDETAVDVVNEIIKRNNDRIWAKFLVVTCTCLLGHIYYGLVISLGSFITTYVVEVRSLPLLSELERKQTGATMTSLFWATFTFFRLLTIFYIDYVGSMVTIFANLVICFVSCIILIPFAASNLICLWAGVGVIGAGLSSIWACLFTLLEDYFPVTSQIGSMLIVCGVLGEFTFPMIISQLIVADPAVLMWISLGCISSIFAVFTTIVVTAKIKLEQIPQRK